MDYNIYGLTETTGPITITLPNYKRHESVGILLDGLRLKINMDGEILVKGESITSGYYKNKRETEKMNNNGWLKTGDIGYLDKGYLFITGRKKDIIITSNGDHISPIPIEENIKIAIPDFEYVLVIGDTKKYLSVLLFPNQNLISKYEQCNYLYGPNEFFNENKIRSDSDSDSDSESESDPNIIIMKEIYNNINNKINDLNKLAPSNSHKIQKWKIILDKFKIGDELTQTFKIKRHFVYKKFIHEIEDLYKD